MKKIISLIGAFALATSMLATASAATSITYSGDVISSLPSVADIETRTPSFTLDAKPVTDKAEVTAAGIPAKQAGNYVKAEYNTYIVTMTATNLGDLAAGYTSDSYETQTGVSLGAITLNFNADEKILKYAAASTDFSDTKTAGIDGTLNMIFGKPADAGYNYPAFDSEANGKYIPNATVTAKMIICVDAGKTVDFTATKALVQYFRKAGDTTEQAKVYVTNPASVKLAPAATGPSYSITKEYKDAANKGYVWDVTISDFNTTKNSAMANFKVSDDEKASAEITGLDGIESDGSCNFAVILNTEKTLAATDGFTITFPAK